MKNSTARRNGLFLKYFLPLPALRVSGFFLLLTAFIPSAGAQGADQSPVLCEDIKKPFFTVSCGDNGLCVAERARRESQAASFWLPKPAGVKRIFVVGESVASLLRTPEDAGLKNGKLEVINCGVGSYESYRIKDVFKQILKYKPDLIVVLSGNNEGNSYACPGAAFAFQRRLKRLLERYYALGSGAQQARIKAGIKLQEMRLDDMAGFARGKKIPLIFCALPANLGGMPPPGALPLQDPAFAAGLAAFEKGRFAEAEKLFAGSAGKAPAGPFPVFYRAKALEGLGRYDDARRAYLDILESDPNQDRASVSRNAMIRALAARRGAGLCALDGAFKAVSKNGIPGLAQFSDAMHWHQKYNALAWSEIAATARAMGLDWFALPGPGQVGDAFPPEELRRSFSYAVSYLQNDPAGPLSTGQAGNGAPVERVIAELDFLEAASPGLAERTALSPQKFREYFIDNFWSRQTAARLEELRPDFLANLAEAKRRRGNFKKALELLKSAGAAGPAKPYYRLIRAQALWDLGRKKEAEAELAPLYVDKSIGAKALAVAAARGMNAAR